MVVPATSQRPKKSLSAKKIAIAMIEADVRVADIARLCGCSHQAISRVISGLSTSLRIQKAIAKAVGADFETLWGLSLDNKSNGGKK